MKTFKQFLSEANQRKPDYLDTVTNNMERAKGIVVRASNTPSGAIRIHGMHVPPEDQRKGIGSWAMRNLQNLGQELRLSQSAKPGREGDLRRFYRKHGFKRDESTPDTYHWRPN